MRLKYLRFAGLFASKSLFRSQSLGEARLPIPRPQLANPDFPMEFAGLPWDFERERGRWPSLKPVRLFTT
ncbi:hypothetical protein [Bradyrhizobium sp. URHD0069]|uniref:hypothetical protein n=1 Tax=Bradyrhizobium sp. URHD0069 TaxID=1380355 RepID=UPI000AC5DD25|nr:hypothetical protein [Bradyrhizobium sp. URHD0069]